jgi:ATP-binding cassette subfamily F protein 3
MSLLVAENLSLSFGARAILDGDGLLLAEGDRVGLVGPNGSGKSTLLKILAGLQRADDGTITRSRGARVAYLPQDVLDLPAGPLLESVLSAVPGKAALEDRLGVLERELAESTDADAQMRCAARLADVHDELLRFDARFSPHEAERILEGLGFRTSDLGRPTSELSGGWRMRAALAGLLFSAPDVLLLDEPTNHLDLPSVRWLSDFLARTKLALVLVCHDREFLNQQVGEIASFEPEGLRFYRGNYDAYVRQRAQEEEILLAAAANQERQRREAERFIERFRAQASKARQVQSRIKRLEKMDEVVTLAHRKRVRVRFPDVERSGAEVLALDGVGKAFGDTRLYEAVSLAVRRGDRIAIAGVNGAGKTTLLKIMAGELEPDAGAVRSGHNVGRAVYAQHHAESLDPSRTILEEIARLVPSWSQERVRTLLGAFLFAGDDVDKRIGVLSGGERARVALAKLLVRPGNLLLMDEPTNHLDTASSEALADALEAFSGTLVFVSHNLSFARRLATKVWDIADGEVVEYPGSFADYLDKTSAAATPTPDPEPSAVAPPPPAGAEAHARRKADAAAEKSRQRRIAELRRRAGELEARIATIEAAQRAAEAQLADPAIYADRERSQALLAEFLASKDKVEELVGRWEATLSELTTAEAKGP